MEKEIWLCLKNDIYVNKKEFSLAQICDIHGVSDTYKLDDIKINFHTSVSKISAFEVSQFLEKLYPGYTITNMGPTECNVILQYSAQNKKFLLIKTVLLCVIMFFGGAITIMTFHEDANMKSVQTGIYQFFTGEHKLSVPVVSIPYSVGVTVGFFMLYGFFSKKKDKPSVLDLEIYDHQDKLKKYLTESNKKDG